MPAYRYDGLGRRIEKDVDGVISRYVYDAEDILLEYDGTNTLIARYAHGPGIDDPAMLERDLDLERHVRRDRDGSSTTRMGLARLPN